MASTKADQRLLKRSVITGNRRMLHHALLKKADVNTRSTLGHTPCHLAALHGDFHAVKKLVGAGADVRLRDHFGDTALATAQAMLDPFAGENGKLLALLSPAARNKASYKEELAAAETGEWVAQHSPMERHRKRRETAPSWSVAPKPKPVRAAVAALSPAELRMQQLRRQQTTVVNHQGLRDRNPRYPACAREKRGKHKRGAAQRHVVEEYELGLKKQGHAPDGWPHACDVRHVKARPRQRKGGPRVHLDDYDIDADCTSGQGYATIGSTFCRAHGGRTGETW